MATNNYSDNFAALTASTTLLRYQTNNVGSNGGRMRYKRMEIELPAAAWTINSVARMGEFKSNTRFINLFFACDDMGTTGTFDIGLYATNGANHDGAVVDQDLFATGIDVNAAAVARTDILLEAAALGIEGRGKALWQMLGLSADPCTNYDLTVFALTATTGGGTIIMEAIYTSGD